VRSIGWSLVAIAAQTLEPEEREAALGDLAEAGESAWRGLADVSGLVLRRQAALWKSWRPWLAGFGLAAPNSFLLMGSSVSVSQTVVWLTGPTVLDSTQLRTLPDLARLLCQLFLLFTWSWAGGFVAASMSRRTLWASGALCALPCLFCLARFRLVSLPAVCLFLFLPAALLGARRGIRIAPIRPGFAIVLALAITVLMLPLLSGGGSGALYSALLWPEWYLVAAGRESDDQTENQSKRTAR
jgi:hypothetical protein